MTIDSILLIGSGLILLSTILAKATDNLGVPTLLLFLAVGMLAGSEGPGGIYFDDARLAQSVGIVALVYILFAGGLDTKWSSVRPVFWHALSLSTFGVIITALAVGGFVSFVFNMPLINGLLLGAVVSSTDAAAVFSVLRSKNVGLRGSLQPLLEFESGSNDPMAVFLTIGLIELITDPRTTIGSVALHFVLQMALGALIGAALGRALVLIVNRLRIAYEGIYSVFVLAFAAFTYGAADSLGGSGFLAVYVAGMVAGNGEFVQKRSVIRFFDGLAWLCQIAMFLTLGLLAFPSHIVPVIGMGILTSLFLIVVARPVSVFASLAFSNFGWREKTFLSWVGLRGAVPIILATFPILAGLSDAKMIFNVVFFIVLTSALLQGWSTPFFARLLRLDAPPEERKRYPIEFAPQEGVDTDLIDFIVPFNSGIPGKSIVELELPPETLIVLLTRNGEFIVPSGGTILQGGDTALVMSSKRNLPAVREIFAGQKT